MFGPSITEFVSSDKVEDEKAYDHFVTKAANHLPNSKRKTATPPSSISATINGPFPIPLTRLPDGKWFFDTEAGKQEILARRIGGNELETINVCHAYV